MGAEARRLRLWPLPTPVGQPRPGGLWLLSMALFMRWLCLRVSVLFSPRMRNTPWVFIPRGHTTPLRITLAFTCPGWPTLNGPCTSCKDHPLEVWSAGSPAPHGAPPLPFLSPEEQLLQEQPWQLGGLFRKLAQALSGILPTLLPTLPGTHPSRSLPVLWPMRQPGAGTALGWASLWVPCRLQAHHIPGSTRGHPNKPCLQVPGVTPTSFLPTLPPAG